ncbi:MAG: DeoR/GlpR family DNA-binding transcription regulator [Pseudochelatococcus sp.]|jgi:DeoR family glycerol-3-phosphate regulon repressor|uniref:DeoR/GlpR family DNA-binding transcription regulator n=1 Tax=Pseudochelatococcus sp. TaxID=2020869 RepID=UPI003D949F28
MGVRLHAEAGQELSARQEEILAIVHHQGFATIDALARHFDVSTQTVRRDIIYLDEQQLLQRFHGGAGVREATVRLGYAEKRITAAEAKERIARIAVGLIKPGETVFLDVGTTVEAVARALRGRSGLRVFTSSLAAATILSAEQDAEVFVTGGMLRGPDGSLTDEWARDAVSRFRFDVAILGFSGIDDDGALMDFDLRKVAVKQAVAARASRTVAVGESSKLLRPAIVRVLDTDRIDTLATNDAPPPLVAETLAKAGVEVLFPQG